MVFGFNVLPVSYPAARIDESVRMLQLDHWPATEAEIVAAYRQRAKEGHPDSGGAGVDMGVLKAARDTLLRNLEVKGPVNRTNGLPGDYPCPMCHGRGSVAFGLRAELCTTCGGAGVMRK